MTTLHIDFGVSICQPKALDLFPSLRTDRHKLQIHELTTRNSRRQRSRFLSFGGQSCLFLPFPQGKSSPNPCHLSCAFFRRARRQRTARTLESWMARSQKLHTHLSSECSCDNTAGFNHVAPGPARSLHVLSYQVLQRLAQDRSELMGTTQVGLQRLFSLCCEPVGGVQRH